jgi:hypothetical protein
MKMKGHVTCMRDSRGAYSVLVGEKKEGKIPLGRPRCGWEDDIKTELPRNITE